MSIAESQRVFTPDDLLTLPDGDQFELVNGQLVERNMSALSAIVATKINARLSLFTESHRLGDVIQSDCGYQCFDFDPQLLRRPDGSFIRKGRLPREQLERGHVRIVPDWVLEVVSPNDLAYEVNDKLEDYRAAGVPLIWIVDPVKRTVDVYRKDGSTARLRANDTISGEDVIPGFQCKVAEFFADQGS